MDWCKPKSIDVQADLEAASQDLGVPMDDLHQAMQGGQLVLLEWRHWYLLRNSDHVFSLAKAEAKAAYYGQDLGPLFRKITGNQAVLAPVVLFRSEQRPWLISGNCQLMVCGALNIRPYIWKIELDGSSS